MSDQYLGEMRVFAFGIVPRGWAACNGQLWPLVLQEPSVYNRAYDHVRGLAAGGHVHVVAPHSNPPAGRLARDRVAITRSLDQGRRAMAKILATLP